MPHPPCKENRREEQASPLRCKGLQGEGQDAGCKCFEKHACGLCYVLQVRHHSSQMSFSGDWDAGRHFYPCDVRCPQPLATSCNDPCVVSCGTSRVIIYPPPIVVTFPGPILSTCPQETVVGSSAVLEGGAPAPLMSLREEVRCSDPPAERFVLKHRPQCAPRCCYVFSSHWMHPCSRPSYRRSQPSENEREEDAPEKEKPETKNTDAANEGEETAEA